MMRRHDPPYPPTPDELPKPPVTQLPGRHLDRNLVRRRILPGIEPPRHYLPSIPHPQPLHKFLIPHTLLPPQLKIAMRDDKIEPTPVTEFRQHNGIQPAAHRQQQPLTRREQSLLDNMILKSL